MDRVPTQDQPAGGQITLRYWAAARAATGTAEEQVTVTGPVPLAWLLADAVRRHAATGNRVAEVLDCCSVLLGDRPVATEDPEAVLVHPGQSVELLPPFAGG